jgi:hypothetical protein
MTGRVASAASVENDPNRTKASSKSRSATSPDEQPSMARFPCMLGRDRLSNDEADIARAVSLSTPGSRDDGA